MTDGRSGTDEALAQVEALDQLIDERTDIAELLDRTAVLRETSRRIREQTGLDLGYAAADENPELVVIRGWAGATGGGLRNLEVPRGLGLGGKAFALGRPVWVPDYCSSAQITHDFDAVIRSEGIGAMVAVPLVHLLFGIGAEVRDLQCDAPAQLIEKLRLVEARVAETAAVFRESLAVLDDVTPEQSLTATLRGDCEAFTGRTAVAARCVALTNVPDLDPARCAAVVAVVREALVNVEKHAQATSVVVSLAATGDGLAVAVADVGLGWSDPTPVGLGAPRPRDPSECSNGIGLKASYDRVARLGGSLSVVGNEDGGLTVRAWIPTVPSA